MRVFDAVGLALVEVVVLSPVVHITCMRIRLHKTLQLAAVQHASSALGLIAHTCLLS